MQAIVLRGSCALTTRSEAIFLCLYVNHGLLKQRHHLQNEEQRSCTCVMASNGFVSSVQEDTLEELDRKRNALFALQLLITIVTMGISFVAMVGGIFGMNLWDNMGNEDPGYFILAAMLPVGIAIAITIVLTAYLRWKRMLFLGIA